MTNRPIPPDRRRDGQRRYPDGPTQRFYAHQALARSLHAMNAELLEFCAERDLPCFDLEPKLEKTLVNFYDDAHLKEPGARRVAELLGEFLAAQVASR